MKMNDPEVLALIPARGGSKGIPRKNIRPFSGHPLVAFSIAAALQSALVTRLIVSTDDLEIAEVAHLYGAETPFMRPAELAADRTTDLPVFQHALTWLEKHEGYRPELVVHLHPTCPVRPCGLLDGAIRQMIDHPEADCTRAVVEPLQTPYKMWRIDAETGRMLPLLAVPGIMEPYNAPRQLLPPAFLQTGHVNVIRQATILGGSMTGNVILPWIIDSRYDVDIDTLADWERGEWIVAQKKLDMVWPVSPENKA